MLGQDGDVTNQELVSRLTVKTYESEKEQLDHGIWRHRRIALNPSFTYPSLEPVVFSDEMDGADLETIAELVEVLG